MTAPSVLLIDDGELDRVQAVLERMPIDWLRCAEPGVGPPLERPRDLIISSGPRSMRMPPLSGDTQPLWVCIYDQDFLPLRERLRDLGVHYLVSGDLAPHAFALFLRQLLNRGEERRQVRRIPMQFDVQLSVRAPRSERCSARMLELSRDSCVVSTRHALPVQQRVSLRLPAEHTGEDNLEISGEVVRTTPVPGTGEPRSHTAVIGFDASDPRAIAHLQDLLSGNVLGTLVTPLAEEPGTVCGDPGGDAGWLSSHGYEDVRPEAAVIERRSAERHKFGRRVEAIRWLGEPEPQVLLAKDLSLAGLGIEAASAPPIRSEVWIALYGRSREEPLLVRAEVVRRDGAEVGLRFVGLAPAQQTALERLLAASPAVEDLAAPRSARHVVELAR